MKRTVAHLVWSNDLNKWVAKVGTSVVLVCEPKVTKRDFIKEASVWMVGLELDGVNGQLVIHRRDGLIQKEYTYGDDPVRTKG